MNFKTLISKKKKLKYVLIHAACVTTPIQENKKQWLNEAQRLQKIVFVLVLFCFDDLFNAQKTQMHCTGLKTEKLTATH